MGCICSKEVISINKEKYRILDTIDGGGFSIVYLVEHMHSRKLFAVKKMVCHGFEDTDTALKEVKYHCTFSHPNILPCLNYAMVDNVNGIDSGASIVYMVSPYYRKGTLDRELKFREKLASHMSTEDVLHIFLQICEAIAVFHNHEPPLTHRDIKPANVLLSPDNKPVIMDLGSAGPALYTVNNASEAQRIKDFASMRCTITYRPPELFNVEANSKLDQRTDIWSLGCLLYAMCFFKSPYDYVHEKGDSVTLAVMSGRVTFPNNSPYPESIHNLILSMLKVNYEERPFIDQVKARTNSALAELDGGAAC